MNAYLRFCHPNSAKNLAVVALLALALPIQAQAENLPAVSTLEQQLQSRDFQRVYQSLQPLEFNFAGQPRYDWAYGVAALQLGKPDEASWALERLVVTQPSNLQAKLALAQAYTDMGRINSAEALAQEVLASNPSARQRVSAENLLSRIQAARQPHRLTLTTRFDAALGYDTNVSSAPGYRFEPGSSFGEKTPSLFSELAARQRLTWQKDDNLSFYGRYRIRDTRPYSESDYLRQNLLLAAGVEYRTRDWQMGVEPGLSKGWLNAKNEFTETALSLNGLYQLQGAQALLGFLTLSSLEYDATPDNNTDFTLIGGGWSGQNTDLLPWTLQITATAYWLTADSSKNPTGDFSGPGAGISGVLHYSQDWQFNARLGLASRSYSCSSSHTQILNLCDASRTEQQLNLAIGARHLLMPRLYLLPELAMTRQSSDYREFDYNRITAKVSVRYDLEPWKR